jgi:peptidyl-prolyl cis-trans isomerase SurA
MTRIAKAASLAAAITAVAALAGAARAQDSPAPLRQGVVAIVNDNIISSFDLAQRVRLIIATSGIKPTEQNLPQIEQEAVSELVDERLELQEVRRAEADHKTTIVANDKEIDERIDEIAQQSYHMSGAQFTTALSNTGISPDTFRDQVRAALSWEHWISGRYGGSRLSISQAQINSVINQREAEAAEPQYLIGEIFIDANQVGGVQAAENGAAQLITQLQQGASFPAVARQFSSASTAATGGDAGWLTASELPPEVRPIIDQLRPGEFAKPIDAQNGVYIILLRDKHAGATSQIVSLKQAAISLPSDAAADAVAAAQQKLMALKSQVKGCDTLEAKAAKVDGVVAGDLGEADVKDLKPEFRDAAMKLAVGDVSDPIRTDAGLHLIALCGRRQAGVDMPSRDEIESRLREEEISLISKRQLRDLRNSATIDFP